VPSLVENNVLYIALLIPKELHFVHFRMESYWKGWSQEFFRFVSA